MLQPPDTWFRPPIQEMQMRMGGLAVLVLRLMLSSGTHHVSKTLQGHSFINLIIRVKIIQILRKLVRTSWVVKILLYKFSFFLCRLYTNKNKRIISLRVYMVPLWWIHIWSKKKLISSIIFAVFKILAFQYQFGVFTKNSQILR